MVGGHLHSFWTEAGFEVVQLENKKKGARCKICSHILKNTTKFRLQAHRNICHQFKQSSSSSVEGIFTSSAISTAYTSTNSCSILFNYDDYVGENRPNRNDGEVIEEFDVETSGECRSMSAKTPQFNQNEYGNTPLSAITFSSSPTPRSIYSNPRPRRRLLEAFADSVDTFQKQRIDNALAEFFFGCNIHFACVDSQYFKNSMEELRPAYRAPCRQTLSTTLLNSVYKKVVTTDSAFVDKESVLIIDGWKNSASNTKQVVTMLHTAEQKSMLFLDSFECASETGEELNEMCEKSILLAKEKYNTNIFCVVSDNAANMVKMGKLSQLIHSTCSSHTGNLLAKDVLDKDVCGEVSLILEEFKRPELERSVIAYGGKKIKLACETRWCSYRDSFQCLLDNLMAKKKIAAEGETKLKQEVTQLISDEEFMVKVHLLIEISNPICSLINDYQRSDYSIADAAQLWLGLDLPDECRGMLEKRKSMALNKYAVTANLLHPKYKGTLLPTENRDTAEAYSLSILDSNGLDSFQNFVHGGGIFRTLKEKNVISPKTYWRITERNHDQLSKVDSRLLKIPASSAQIERLFSNWSFIHSDLRNKLGPEKSQKLVHVYYSLRLRDDLDLELDNNNAYLEGQE